MGFRASDVFDSFIFVNMHAKGYRFSLKECGNISKLHYWTVNDIKCKIPLYLPSPAY